MPIHFNVNLFHKPQQSEEISYQNFTDISSKIEKISKSRLYRWFGWGSSEVNKLKALQARIAKNLPERVLTEAQREKIYTILGQSIESVRAENNRVNPRGGAPEEVQQRLEKRKPLNKLHNQLADAREKYQKKTKSVWSKVFGKVKGK